MVDGLEVGNEMQSVKKRKVHFLLPEVPLKKQREPDKEILEVKVTDLVKVVVKPGQVDKQRYILFFLFTSQINNYFLLH